MATVQAEMMRIQMIWFCWLTSSMINREFLPLYSFIKR